MRTRKRYRSDLRVNRGTTTFRGTYEIERLSSDGEEERRNFDREHDCVETCSSNVKQLGEAAQLEF